MAQNKPSSACYCLRTRKASAALTNFYDKALSPCAVRQYSLLLNISRALSCSVRQLAGLADLDRSTLARSLKPLFKQGFIIDAKSPGTRDSRLELTKCGQETVLAAGEFWAQAQKAVERHFGQSGLKELESVMARLEAL